LRFLIDAQLPPALARRIESLGQADQTGTSKHDQYYAALFDSIVESRLSASSTSPTSEWLLSLNLAFE
jgi:hypothetical protein